MNGAQVIWCALRATAAALGGNLGAQNSSSASTTPTNATRALAPMLSSSRRWYPAHISLDSLIPRTSYLCLMPASSSDLVLKSLLRPSGDASLCGRSTLGRRSSAADRCNTYPVWRTGPRHPREALVPVGFAVPGCLWRGRSRPATGPAPIPQSVSLGGRACSCGWPGSISL